MNSRNIISVLLLVVYGLILTHRCMPCVTHEYGHGHEIVANSIYIDEDGCYTHSEDGEHECHHHNQAHQHQHPDKYNKTDIKKSVSTDWGTTLLCDETYTDIILPQEGQKRTAENQCQRNEQWICGCVMTRGPDVRMC